MELKEFTKQTLLQIIEGVKEAQNEALVKDAYINPVNLYTNKDDNTYVKINDKNIQVTDVNFEVEVSTIDENEKEGGAGIFVGSFKIGTRKSDTDKAIATNKITFTVPLALPVAEYNANNTPLYQHVSVGSSNRRNIF